jgi:hypothetical protein
MSQYPPLFKPLACETANKACRQLGRDASLAKVNGDWDAYTKAVRAKKILWLDTYLAAAEGED